jgi:hypothetical protein
MLVVAVERRRLTLPVSGRLRGDEGDESGKCSNGDSDGLHGDEEGLRG